MGEFVRVVGSTVGAVLLVGVLWGLICMVFNVPTTVAFLGGVLLGGVAGPLGLGFALERWG
jgi:hypothetical protein